MQFTGPKPRYGPQRLANLGIDFGILYKKNTVTGSTLSVDKNEIT